MKKYYFAILLCFCCLWMTGCKQDGIKGLVPCSGVVLKNGQPVEEVSVTLIPMDATSESRTANGRTDVNGQFTATTQKWNGILPGKYKVALTKRITKTNPGQESVEESYRTVTHTEHMGKYANADQSGLIVEIPKSGDKNLKIEIQE
jgi:5-hydroxyisourate hydrolase-like protein (transthyretin family)